MIAAYRHCQKLKLFSSVPRIGSQRAGRKLPRCREDVVDVAGGARQAVEKDQYESADAMEFDGLCEHIIQLGEELPPRRRKGVRLLVSRHLECIPASCH